MLCQLFRHVWLAFITVSLASILIINHESFNEGIMKIFTFIFAVISILNLKNINAKEIHFTIYHTNDLHSHLSGSIIAEGKNPAEIRGGYDRLTTVIKNLKIKKSKENEIIMGVDAGDFFSGTIYSAIAPSLENDFPELEFFDDNKFDVITLGNHEFDGNQLGLERMLRKANFLKFNNSQIVATNLYIKNEKSSLVDYVGDDLLIKSYVVKEFKAGNSVLKVAFFGMLGPDACMSSTSTRGDVGFIGFNDNKNKANLKTLINYFNTKIKEIKQNENVDLVVLTTHSGGVEVEQLASKLKEVDVIIAGHTHEVQKKIIDNKIIAQTGGYGANLGVLELKFDNQSKKVSFRNFTSPSVININKNINQDPIWKDKIEKYRMKSYELMGMEYQNSNHVIFQSKKDYPRETVIQNELGKMISTRLRYQMKNEGIDSDFYLSSMGFIRNSIYKNIGYTKEDIIELIGAGFDQDLLPGGNTTTVYLTPTEVKKLINFLEFYSHFSINAAPVFSDNLTFEIHKFGIPLLNKVQNIKLDGKNLNDYTRLIKIGMNVNILKSIGVIAKATHGFIKIVPKDSKGSPITNYIENKKEYYYLINSFINNPEL
jgi:2',3'-cyclic-nucleotide 2'-phosphodiesterase (5'-nucleotidase family)